MSEKIKTFRDLRIWQTAMQIAREIYQLTSDLPAEEKFGLVSQMRRAAISLPSNVAEGFRRRNQAEFRQFLHVALGSAAELETQLELCEDLYFNRETKPMTHVSNLMTKLNEFQAMTMTLIKEINSCLTTHVS
jgi:four helix bundle protein